MTKVEQKSKLEISMASPLLSFLLWIFNTNPTLSDPTGKQYSKLLHESALFYM